MNGNATGAASTGNGRDSSNNGDGARDTGHSNGPAINVPSTAHAPAGQHTESVPRPVPDAARLQLRQAQEGLDGRVAGADAYPGAIGRTAYDVPGSQHDMVTAIVPVEQLECGTIALQTLVRIRSGMPQQRSRHSRGSTPVRRDFVAEVTGGPYFEPDGLRGDSGVLVAIASRGGLLMPAYHGRVELHLLGEEVNGALVEPRHRPLPNSPVFALESNEVARLLASRGDLRLGMALDYRDIPVMLPGHDKSCLARHTGVLGTTGGGKSITVALLTYRAQSHGLGQVLLDVEGEHTHINEPTNDPKMLALLPERGLAPAGVQNTCVYHLAGRRTANPRHPDLRPFTLEFCRLSPWIVQEILDLNDPQAQRFHQAYDTAKAILRELSIFPEPGNQVQERRVLELDEFEEGYPRLTLSLLLDVVLAFLHTVGKQADEPDFYNQVLKANAAQVLRRVQAIKTDSATSWRALYARLWRLKRLDVFDHSRAPSIDYHQLVRPGQVSIVDLSDTSSSVLRNLVIADLLRGIQDEQDVQYDAAVKSGGPPPRTIVTVEEAHEFLSAARIDRMPILYEQFSRIANRGRKRWLGLVLVTQHPQHLPSQLLSQLNNYILHRIADPALAGRLQKTIPGLDEGHLRRLARLAPGQALISLGHMAQPIPTSIDPAPCKLGMVE